jgi:signal transduction histidine kinase
VQLNEVIQSTVGLIGEQFRIRGIELKCELDPDLPPVLGNPFSLEEVFVNLLSNCRDAIEERRDNPGLSSMCEPHVIVRTGVPKEKNRVEAEVIDHGTGIPKELIPRVFEPFFTTKDTKRGTGLGLPIAKSIIEDSGGEIDIRSTLGSGTSVIIRLPVLEKC